MHLRATVFLLAVSTFAISQTSGTTGTVPLPNGPASAQSAVDDSTQSAATPQAGAPVAPQTPVMPESPTPQQQTKPMTSEEVLQQEEHQRVLGVVPNFNSVSYYDNVPPLTAGQKFRLAFRSSTDPVVFVAVALVAGIGQAENSHAGFGQGAQGYGKRLGASYADTVDGTLWGNAILPVLFKEDPRYFRLGRGTVKHRLLYSIATTVWARRDNGSYGPAYANILGNFIAGGISNVYYPADDRGVGTTIDGALTVTAEGSIGALFIEFIPDLSKKFLHKKNP